MMDEADPRRAHHDMGGVQKYFCHEIDTEPHTLSAFDKRVDAIRQLLSAKGLMTVDELRRGIEELPEDEYHALTYYERWIRSIRATLVRKGVVTEEELLRHARGSGHPGEMDSRLRGNDSP